MTSFSAPTVNVAIAVVRKKADEEWRILVTRRRKQAVLGDLWEFPGGKMEGEETPQQAICRELMEELGLAVEPEEPWPPVEYTYPHARVRLWTCLARPLSDRLEHREVQEHRWVSPGELAALDFPPANAPIVHRLMRELASALPPEGDSL